MLKFEIFSKKAKPPEENEDFNSTKTPVKKKKDYEDIEDEIVEEDFPGSEASDEDVGNSSKSKQKKRRKGSWGNDKQDSSSFGKQDKSWKGEEKEDIEEEVEEKGTLIDVYLKNMFGKTIAMQVKDGITVASLKQKYLERPDSTDFVTFVRSGKRLDPNLTLKDSGVEDESTLHMINE